MIPLTVPVTTRLLTTPPARARPATPNTGQPGGAITTKPCSRWYHQRTRVARIITTALVS
jgi:hypothetical protein